MVDRETYNSIIRKAGLDEDAEKNALYLVENYNDETVLQQKLKTLLKRDLLKENIQSYSSPENLIDSDSTIAGYNSISSGIDDLIHSAELSSIITRLIADALGAPVSSGYTPQSVIKCASSVALTDPLVYITHASIEHTALGHIQNQNGCNEWFATNTSYIFTFTGEAAGCVSYTEAKALVSCYAASAGSLHG